MLSNRSVTYSPEQVLWALGSLCALHQKPFAAELVAPELPSDSPEGIEPWVIIQAGERLGFKVKPAQITPERVSRLSDPAKGLCSLAVFDANTDGRIDVLDPVYAMLKVWQDLNQDGNHTHSLEIGPHTETAQDETNGVQEFRSLADWGITAIDYGYSRYEYASSLPNSEVGYGSISTQTLEAKEEGVLYTAVQGGIRIDATDGKPEVLVTQALVRNRELSCQRQSLLNLTSRRNSEDQDGSIASK